MKPHRGLAFGSPFLWQRGAGVWGFVDEGRESPASRVAAHTPRRRENPPHTRHAPSQPGNVAGRRSGLRVDPAGLNSRPRRTTNPGTPKNPTTPTPTHHTPATIPTRKSARRGAEAGCANTPTGETPRSLPTRKWGGAPKWVARRPGRAKLPTPTNHQPRHHKKPHNPNPNPPHTRHHPHKEKCAAGRRSGLRVDPAGLNFPIPTNHQPRHHKKPRYRPNPPQRRRRHPCAKRSVASSSRSMKIGRASCRERVEEGD